MPKTIDALPDYAKLIIVPVSNPDTAAHLLELACTLAHPEEGRVIALIVSLGDAEDANKRTEAIQPIVKQSADEGKPVELVAETATSISRGILDVARENGADLIVLGLQQPDQGKVVLGRIVENVIETAPCDVLVYRASLTPSFNRVVVPIDGTLSTTIACNLGVLLARRGDAAISTMNIQRNYRHQQQNEDLIRQSLERIPNRENIQKAIITDSNPAAGILRRLTEDDLLILGFWQQTELEQWLEESHYSHDLLNRAPGPVILVSRFKRQTDLVGRVRDGLRRRALRWMPTLTGIEQQELVWQERKNSISDLDYIVLILVSAILATLGLILNSPAVIIGAMLVAPLMQPLAAFSVGLTTARTPLLRRTLTTLIEGIVLALLVSIVLGTLLPVDTPTDEMLSRGNPTLVDAVVALASGVVAAYATARKGIPAALAGVAIAAALMPPVCTIGLGFAFRDADLALGAALLFITNITFIVVAGGVVFVWLGMRPQEEQHIDIRAWWGGVIAILLLVMLLLVNLGRGARDEQFVQDYITRAFAPAQLVELDVRSNNPFYAVAMFSTEDAILPETVRRVNVELTDLLGRPVQLQVIQLTTVTMPDASEQAATETLTEQFDFGTITTITITRQDDESLVVTATLRARRAPSSAEMQTAQDSLSATLGAPVSLQIVFQRVLQPAADE